MKKTTVYAHLTATALFSYLFYNQGIGINLGLFTFLLIVFLGFAYPHQLRKKQWLAAAALCTITAITVVFNASLLNIVLTLLSIFVLVYTCVHEKLSVLTGGFFAGVSVASSFWIALVHKFLNLFHPLEKKQTTGTLKWTYFLLPVFALVVFFVLYRQASGAFAHLTSQIDLSFISVEWVAFTIFGYFILFGVFKTPAELNFFAAEIGYGNVLQPETKQGKFGFYQTGVILFYTLNALLLLVVVSDFVYIFVQTTDTRTLNHSEIVHQGIEALIVSLILAVFFILLWFQRKNTNSSINLHLTIGAILWACLNALLILGNVYKNTLYIDAHGLTYKRIGVYFALLLALTVIVTCIYKVLRNKNNWFMYRSFGLSLLVIGLAFNSLHWDKIITKHNIAMYAKGQTTPDVHYMLNLSPDCLPLLYNNWEILNASNNSSYTALLENKIEIFCASFVKNDWRSRSINGYSTYAKLKTIRLSVKHKDLLDNGYRSGYTVTR